jgi:taurine transport system substrate-binding protein
MRKFLVACLLLIGLGHAAFAQSTALKRIGYVRTAAPWLMDVQDGRFDEIDGQSVKWIQFQTSAEVALALDAGGIDAGITSSAAMAAAITRGLDLQLIWVVNVVNARHVVIFRDGTGIERTRPATMAGKRVGVTFLSAAHDALLTALSANGLSSEAVRLVNLPPADIEAAWKNGRVDAVCLGGTRTAGVLAAIAGERILLEPSADAPFHGLVASPAFIARDGRFLTSLVAVLANAGAPRTDPSPRGRPARGRDPRDREDESPVDPGQYSFPTLAEQLGAQWLGGPGEPGAARRLAATAERVSPVRPPRVLVDYRASIATELLTKVAATSPSR